MSTRTGARYPRRPAFIKLIARFLVLLVAVGGLVACGPTADERTDGNPGASGFRSQASVVRIVDGDTLVVDLDDIKTKIRLLNVDTPETKDPNKPVECLGPEASAFLNAMLPPGTVVELEYDGEKLDRYGRTLAGVWLRDALVNAEIARAGLGVPVQYNGQVKFLPPVQAAAKEAKRLKKGAYAAGVSCALPSQGGT